MRLVQRNESGELSLTEDLADEDVPSQYAILSHTWSHGEVTFEDMKNGTVTAKAGYEKIQFCADQAEYDHLKYFWVDTCCIDKSSNVQLQHAINSMFRWYHNATKCYVYLSDVSWTASNAAEHPIQPWEAAFRKSKWFTRGWTLQELIAPRTVEFFSGNKQYLGNKKTLERQICEITGIPVKALQGEPLAAFSVTERIVWAELRETRYQEDTAYSLLGFFGVYMPLNYGEGKANAFRRLREEIARVNKGKLH
jgi:hypothetical protein